MAKNRNKDKIYYLIALLVTTLAISLAICKYPRGDVNFYNSDATYHVMLTMQAYDETPISVHKFLPIVSLGDPKDKGITWGDCIPDSEGNYYYTSFSAATFLLPYIFLKIFHLPNSVESLYLYNSTLYVISAILFIYLLSKLYETDENRYFVIAIGGVLYVTVPEILHSMGITYWAQSVMQVALLVQALLYIEKEKTKKAKIMFYVMCVANPFIEWTGFVANIGYWIVEAAPEKNISNEQKKKKMITVIAITISTTAAALLFVGHFMMSVDAKLFFSTVFKRFMVRSTAIKTGPMNVLEQYVFSLKWILGLLVLMFVLFGIQLVKKKKRISVDVFSQKSKIIFVLSFACAENLIMKQHAILYSFDRMKLVYPIIIIICDLITFLLKSNKNKSIRIALLAVIVAASSANTIDYLKNDHFVDAANYRKSNRNTAQYINENYSDSTLGTENTCVRGYMNMLFGRGIHEKVSEEELLKIARADSTKYAIMLNAKEEEWHMDRVNSAVVINTEEPSKRELINLTFDDISECGENK